MRYEKLSDDFKQEVIKFYCTPKTIKETCKKFKISDSTLYKILKERNIKKRTRQDNGQRIYTVNKKFFYNESPDLAYFLGLMGADGCVSGQSNIVFIELKQDDWELLDTLRDKMCLARPIKFYHTKKGYHNAKLYFEDKEIHNLLISRYKLCPNKTYDTEHFDVPDLDVKYYADYIRGYFDGDGSIKNSNGTLTFQIDGSNLKVILHIKQILKQQTGVDLSLYCEKPPKKRINSHCRTIPYYRIICYGQNAKKIFEFLYYDKNSNIYLKRKYKRYLEESKKYGN